MTESWIIMRHDAWIYLASFEMEDFDNELGHVETLLGEFL